MQTFILHENMGISAGRLDIRRRFKQAVECKQIYQALAGLSKGWTKHPAVLQWSGYADYLLAYGWHCLQNCIDSYDAPNLEGWYKQYTTGYQQAFPSRFHKLIPFHQGLLLRKDYHYYKHIFPNIPSTGWARYLDIEEKVFHIKFGERIYD